MSRLFRVIFSRKTLAYAAGGTALTAGTGYWYLNSGPAYPASSPQTRRAPPPWTPPTRAEMLARLKASGSRVLDDDDDDIFDMLIVGGGATGAGIAVDAASRGLKVALVERDDFSSGTSSKSTKLVHGGVRYLQKAVMELDYSQYKLVTAALHERKIFLHTAPYLSHMLPIMLPIYKYWQVPYYWAGCKLYDVLSGKENMESSYLMSKGKAIETFPMLKTDGLVGALIYYDGQHNDSRMNIALIMTAVKLGATALNYCKVTALHKDNASNSNSNEAGQQLTGAQITDTLTNTSFPIRARTIVNATGPFSDSLMTMDNPSHVPIVQPSSGTHITLPNYYSPRKMGLLDPATSDGRVIFFLPWQGNTIAGTTDTPVGREVLLDTKDGGGGGGGVAPEEEIRWILEEVRRYLSPDIKVRRGDVLSAWSGLRPLIRMPETGSASSSDSGGTQGLVRSHIVHLSPSGLLTVAGGKWTTYREMAQEAVDVALEKFPGLKERIKKRVGGDGKCRTEDLRLVGSEGWSRNMFIGLIQRYGLDTEVAKHLSDNYGDRAWTVCSLAEPTGQNWPLHGKRLSPQYPFIEAEVHYAITHEYALTAIDILARRTRLAFLNVHAALEALPHVVDIMAGELGWSYAERQRQIDSAVRFFVTSMGLPAPGGGAMVPEVIPRGKWENAWVWCTKGVWRGLGWGGGMTQAENPTPAYAGPSSRARFDPGELAALTVAFEKHASGFSGRVVDGEQPVQVQEAMMSVQVLSEAVREVGGYEGATEKEFDYVLEEAGMLKGKGKREGLLNFDEFIEICGNLKEVVFAPSSLPKKERLRIPVEKSGGGV